MRIPPQKRIQETTVTAGVISILNNFMDFVYRAFAKNITIEENTPYQIKEVSFTTTSTYSGGTFVPLELKIDPQRIVKGVVVLWISSGTVTATPRWSQVGANVVISNLSGLSNSTEYTIRLLII